MPGSVPTLNLLGKSTPWFMYLLSFTIYCIWNQDDQLVFHIIRFANKKDFRDFPYKMKSFKHAHFAFCVSEWNKLESFEDNVKSIKQIKSILIEIFTLKSGSHLERSYFCLKSSLKMMKNASYFMLNVLSLLNIFKALSWLSDHLGKRLDKKAKVNSEFMASQTGKQIITIHILPNIARSKGSQTMKFRQLTESNILKKHTQSVVEKLVTNPFIKKLKFSISLDQVWNIITLIFIISLSKRGLGLVFLTQFSAWCLKRNISHIILFTLKRIRNMIITYSQMHRTDKYSQHNSIIWPVWINGWVFVYGLSVSGFESRCCQIKQYQIY